MADPYLSEVLYLGSKAVDFIEIAVDPGSDVSGIQVVIYKPDGTIRSINTLGTSTGTSGGKDIYVVDNGTGSFTGLSKTGGVAIIKDGVVISFSSFDDGSPITATEGDASGETSVQIGQAGAGESLETTDDGGSYATQTTPTSGAVPCFTPGTLIATPAGLRKVETLKPGDMVLTKDNGPKPLRWIGQKVITGDFARARDLQPVRIKAHAFGAGFPHADLLVSPNHRILVQDGFCNLLFDTTEVLIAAKFLLNDHSISQDSPKTDFTYVHLLFDQHEVVCSNGLDTESFHPGKIGLDAFDKATAHEVLTLFPHLRSGDYGPTARLDLRRYEGAILSEALAQPRKFLESHAQHP
ncbi:MAG: hypothetical protein ACI861_000062 [Paracoccaceae bacterium]|jgi:hypothetical protein